MRPIPRPSSSAATATNALPTISRPRTPSSTPPTYVSSTSTRPTSRLRPGRTMARRNCAARSRRLHSYPNPRPAATPARWPRLFALSPTKPPGTTTSRACGCPGKSCPPSPRPGNRSRRRAADCVCWPMRTGSHSAGHTNPSGQRSFSRYSRHASSVENRASNSTRFRG